MDIIEVTAAPDPWLPMREYLDQALAGFRNDPSDSAFQEGYHTALEEVQHHLPPPPKADTGVAKPLIDLSDLSRSYPFLALSRKLQLDYCVVLRMADLIDRGLVKPISGPISLVEAVCRAPWRWQYPPQGRGL